MLVCPPVFKTGEGGEELPRWVRFPHVPATKGKRRVKTRRFLLFRYALFKKNAYILLRDDPAHDAGPGGKGLELFHQLFGVLRRQSHQQTA